MKLIVRKKQAIEVFESPEDEGLGVEVAGLKDGTLGLKVIRSNKDNKREVGFIPLAKGALEEAESLEDLVSMAVEDPEYGGSSLEYLVIGDQVIYDRYGDSISAEDAWRRREGYMA